MLAYPSAFGIVSSAHTHCPSSWLSPLPWAPLPRWYGWQFSQGLAFGQAGRVVSWVISAWVHLKY